MPYELDKNGDVKMWTGNGYATVSPNYVSQYERQGWSTQLPSQTQINDLISNPMQTGQSYNTGTGKVDNRPPASGSSIFDNNTGGLTNPKTNTINKGVGGVPSSGSQSSGDPYDKMMADYQAQQKALADAQRQSRIAALGKARDNSLANLDNSLSSVMTTYAGEQAALKPQYYNARNQVAANADIQAKNFAEYQASRGVKGAAAAQPEIYRNIATQGQIGALNQQQAAANEDIARRQTEAQTQYDTNKAGIQNAYESDVASANADVNADSLQAYMDAMKMVQAQKAADNAAMGLTSTGELTPTGQKTQNDLLSQQAAIQAAAHYNDIDAYIKTLNPNDPMIPYLQAARQQKIQDQAEQAAAQAAAASEAEQQRYKNAFDMWKTYGTATADIAGVLGVPVGARTADYNIDSLNAATSQMNANTSRMNANTSRINANKTSTPKYSYNTDPQFQSEVTDITTGASTLDDVKANAAALQAAYGYDGYMELVKLATSAK